MIRNQDLNRVYVYKRTYFVFPSKSRCFTTSSGNTLPVVLACAFKQQYLYIWILKESCLESPSQSTDVTFLDTRKPHKISPASHRFLAEEFQLKKGKSSVLESTINNRNCNLTNLISKDNPKHEIL
jgi:hypothetical protein